MAAAAGTAAMDPARRTQAAGAGGTVAGRTLSAGAAAGAGQRHSPRAAERGRPAVGRLGFLWPARPRA
ncbi:hypothetical protein G6F60_014957 [Rhizopus arrhizus]|nr:hypothetical protein G6F60_014957 [Rhizopus arrhizus]